MRKIFHIISNKEWGGGEQYVFDLVQRQLAEGWKVELFCRPIKSITDKFYELGIPIYILPLKGIADLKSALCMKRVLNAAGPCIVHAHNFKDAFTAAYARKFSSNKNIKLVLSRHLTRPGKNSFPYRWLYRQLDSVGFGSAISRDTFLSTRPTIDAKKLSVIHTSIVVPSYVEPAPIRQEFGINQGCVLGMYHGRLAAEKGLDTLLDAIKEIKEKHFHVIFIGRGDNDYTEHLQKRIEEEGLSDKITLAGFRHPILPYVAAADFGILASTVSECCPLSPQEYMSQEHPVIATNNGGQREYISDHTNGLLVSPGNSSDLATALARIIDDTPLREKLGKQAKADFDSHMNYDYFFQKICKLYAALSVAE